jgi:predicted AlkP superfamily pyrophosphatase or phosphodiesterase
MTEEARVLFISIPGLSQKDIEGGSALFLQSISEEGDMAVLVPELPATACPAQAHMFTGRRATEHGMVADSFYLRTSHEVLCMPGYSGAVEAPRIWDLFKARRSKAVTALLFFDQTKFARADIVVTPDPVVMEDGGLLSRCYSRPRSLFPELQNKLRWFDLESYEGRSDSQYAMRWISAAAEYVLREFKPRLTMVRFPHLGHALTKHGPDSRESKKVLSSLDALLGHLVQTFRAEEGSCAVVVASEYSFSRVTGAIHINREFREAELLSVQEIGGRELIDFEESKAFAVTDFQVAHVYCQEGAFREVAQLLNGLVGVQEVLGQQRKRELGINHPRSGDLVCLSQPDSWFTYTWWLDETLAPSFPRQGSSALPGCDPLELFIEPGPGFPEMPADVSLVKGSHGLTPEFGGTPGVILCDEFAARELRINRLLQTEVFTLLGHLLR